MKKSLIVDIDPTKQQEENSLPSAGIPDAKNATADDAAQYLARLRRERRRLTDTQAALESASELSRSVRAVRYDTDRVQTSPRNALEDCIVRLELMKTDYLHQLVAYSEHTMEALHLLEQMDNPAESITLRLYYIDGIAYSSLYKTHPLRYSQRHIARLLHSGLESFAAVMTENHIAA